ncbi:M20 family metallopeptidase [Psychrobacillus sp. FJAT-21963]|uniref:M20 family metallopeptidase n=1 Tax=Psychrobacillus sp. FJAT-21963 TaxID=1712028 RepID=UPI0006FCE523|nr:M20 family metallopeptidase [Psychrobacillus sp. FJAT-21963]KQL36711.1 amidohydrolase [Psychrobacillus sp. FJAT-21963]
MSFLVEKRDYLHKLIEDNKNVYIQISHQIHENPEIGNEEFFASSTLIDLLESANFQVEKGIAGHETSFYAIKDSGIEGPTVAFLAEYDALPSIGHADGHNIIGTASVAASISLAEMLNETGGRIIVLGTPAAEGGSKGSSKGNFVRLGYLEDVDVALIISPSSKTTLSCETLALESLDFHFIGQATHPTAASNKTINALEAVVQFFNGIHALRSQLPSDISIHGIITHGGDSPNIIPFFASARIHVSAKNWKKTEEISEKVRFLANGATLVTGTSVKIERFQNEVQDFVVNSVLDEVIHSEFEAIGEVVYTESKHYNDSTDAGNISYVVPTARPSIKIGPDDLVAHTIEFREAAKSKAADEALIKGAKVLATTGYRILTDAKLLHQIRKEFNASLARKAKADGMGVCDLKD